MQIKRDSFKFKIIDKLIGHSIWAWLVATLFLLIGLVTSEHWYVITLVLMGGRVAEGVVTNRKSTNATEEPESPASPHTEA